MLISTSFGRWEAILDAFGGCGVELGAGDRPNNDTFCDQLLRRTLETGGTLIIVRSAAGNRALLRRIRRSGVLAILADRYQQTRAATEAIGQAACTTLSPAELAQRSDLPLIPALGSRIDDRGEVDIEFEVPTSPEQMMQAFNTQLATQVRQVPNQRYWFHRLWYPYKNALVWLTGRWSVTAGNEDAYV